MSLLLLTGWLFVGHAQDDTAEEADLAFELGVEAYGRGEYRTALTHLLVSNRLVPNKNVVYNIARAYEKLGELENAYNRYTDYVGLESGEADRREGEDAIRRLATRVALIRLETDPPGATIYVERRDLGARGRTPRTIAVKPGPTSFTLELDGYVPATADAVAVRARILTVPMGLVQRLGDLEVFGTDGARIYVDSGPDPVGVVPSTIQLPPGQHVLRFVAEGYGESRQLVTVELGAPIQVDANLGRLLGRVVVDASERGALIEVDGVAAGFSPAVIEVPVGDHQVRISSQGFTPYEAQVTVAADTQIPLDVRLSRAGLLGLTVTTATKSERTSRRTPALVTVVQREEILARGYRSIAEILRTVPGFYDVYDLSVHNIAVRGVSGGARASGNVLKLMIDGQPVPYRPTTGNFFGEELIPIDAVERIEVVRGPSSALYGANAYLGVVNVITRHRGGNAVVGATGVVAGNPAFGGALTFQGASDAVDAMVSVATSRTDQSGFFVADSSPELARSTTVLFDRGLSTDDIAAPESLIGRLAFGQPDHATGQWSAWASVQHLETGGEFLDNAPLTHQSHVSIENRTLKLGWSVEPDEGFGIDARVVWFDSGPGASDRIGLGREDKVLVRNVGAVGQEAGVEGLATFGVLQTIAGVDWTRESQILQTYDELLLVDVLDADGQVVRDAFTVLPGEGTGEQRTLTNVGVYAQAIVDVNAWFSATAGARLDQHNIYDQNISPRAGVVVAPPQAPWSAKLLFGTSFKAPSAEQLFTQPIGPFDILGNEALRAQYARNVDLAGTWGIEQLGELEANVFFTQVRGLVEYVQHDINLQAENALDEDIVGAELAARLGPLPWLSFQLGAGVAGVTWQRLDDDQALIFGTDRVAPTFPSVQVHLITELRVPSVDVRFAPELSIVGARSASQSNNLRTIEDYTLPAYAMVSASLSAPTLHLARAYATSIAIRGTDLLGTQPNEPGFNGIDYPTLGARVWLNVTQEF